MGANGMTTLFKTKQHAEHYQTAYENSLSLWNVDYESNYVFTEYGKTHVIRCGKEDGKPLVLLHGFGFSSTMWYANIERFALTHRVYAVDVIGEFNRSEIERHFTKRSDYAHWLSQVLDRLGISKASFIGHSNGGWHVLNFAMHEPDRVERMVLLAPAASFTRFSLQFPIRLLAANFIKTRSIIIDFCGKWFVAKGNHISEYLFEQFYHGLKGFSWKYKILPPSVFSDEELSRLRIPCLMMLGDAEVIYDIRKAVRRAEKLMPHIKIVTIAGAGHALSVEKSEEVNRHTADFLQ